METVHKNDFIELSYTGTANGEVFDSNIAEDLKKISTQTPKKLIIAVGHNMIVPGLDKFLEGKEGGKEYTHTFPAKEGFGERNREHVKTIPLKVFTERNIAPRPGMMLNIDEMIIKIVAVSGARVVADFNNPLAGKALTYKFTILRKVTDDKERATALFETMLRFVPDFEVRESIVIKAGKEFEVIVNAFKDKFKELIGKELTLEIVEKKVEKTETAETHDHTHPEHHDHAHTHQEHKH